MRCGKIKLSSEKVNLWGAGTMRTQGAIWFAREMGITLPDFYRDWQLRIEKRLACMEMFPMNCGGRPLAGMRN